MNIAILTNAGIAAGFDQCKINRALERIARSEVAKTVTLPPTEWMDIDDTSGSSGAPAHAGCV